MEGLLCFVVGVWRGGLGWAGAWDLGWSSRLRRSAGLCGRNFLSARGPCPKGWWRGERIFVRPEFAPRDLRGEGAHGEANENSFAARCRLDRGGVGGVEEIFLSRGETPCLA